MSNLRKPTSKEVAFSPSWAFKSLRDRTLQTLTAGGRTIRVVVEPMLARPGMFPAVENAGSNARIDGAAQPIRIQSDFPITTARIGVNGQWFVSKAEVHSQGVRVYFPEIDEATTIRLILPEAPEFGEIVVPARPVRKWQVHLVHHSHLDIGYTDPQPRVLREQVSFLDTALEHVEDSATGPTDRQFKWVVESLHTFQLWEKHRTGRTIDRFIDQVRLGNIELTAAPYNMATETASTPELYELFRYTQEVRARYGLEIPVAMQTDVPGVVTGFVDALADNNVKYLSVAHNWAGRSAPHLRDAEEMPQLFWLRAHNGGRVLTWMTDSGHGLAYQEGSYIGFSQSYDMVDDLFPLYISSLEVNAWPFDEKAFGFGLSKPSWTREPYPHDIVHFRVQGRLADNAPANRRISETVAEWNGKWEYPQLQMSTNEAFFKEAESTLGDSLPEFRGDWHNWWADGAGSSARGLQLARQGQNKLTQIETLATLLPEHPGAEVARSVRDAWSGIALFDEHTWGAADPWTWGDVGRGSQEDQWHWKFSKVQDAEQEVLLLEDDIALRLAEQLGHSGDGDATIWAVNTHAHARGGEVTAFLPESVCSLETVVELSDPRTGATLPHREIPQVNPYHREAGRFLVFRIEEVAGLGFERIRVTKKDRVEIRAPYFAEVPDYDVPHSAGVVTASAVDSSVLSSDGRTATLENEHLRVSLNISGGAISEILLKAETRNLVDGDSAFGFNAYVYDEYATASKINHMSGHSLVIDDDLALLASRTVNEGAFNVEFGSDGVGQWLSYRTRCGDNEVTTRLDLAAGSDVLRVSNRVKKPATFDKEAGFFAFPFAIDQPTVRSEVSGSVIGTDIEQVPGSVHYMHAIRHWVSLSSGNDAATLVVVDAPLVQIGDIALPYLPFPPTLAQPEPSTVFSWVHNNQWDTNYPLQQGLDMEFRYAVSGGKVASPDEAAVQAAAIASAIVQPIRGVLATPLAAGSGHEQRPTTMAIDHDGVRLIDRTWLDDGRMLCRFQSVITEPLTVGVHCAGAESVVAASMLGSTSDEVAVSDGRFALSVPALGAVAVVVTLA